MNFTTSPGSSLPLGPSASSQGVNFSLFSQHATSVLLCLFDPKSSKLVAEIPLMQSGYLWHIFVHDLPKNYHYGYRVDGPFDPQKGHRFDNRLILLDPYAKQIVRSSEFGEPVYGKKTFLGVVDPLEPFDWEGDEPLNTSKKDLIIYEMHVRGFTQDPSSQVESPGTFAALIEKIPYLQSLGVNAVELMPVHSFNEMDNLNEDPLTGMHLYQYWGYATVNFFALQCPYAGSKNNPITEFKQLVKALHKAGIEVILDVVYNHTAEGNEKGVTSSFRGIDNATYYMLDAHGHYMNYSGCGNTFNTNHPVVSNLILDSLRYYADELHVDGFRFDLASILTRAPDGTPLPFPPVVKSMTHDPLLASVKLLAEAWDAAGLYQVGSFPGDNRWSEWNGKFRDNVRRFIKGDDSEINVFATRLCGSEDLYGGKGPLHSINYIACHDGFTLRDVVSYNEKHNEENGEDNRDGNNQNDSWNCGEEGPTENADILFMREKQMRNYHLALMVSQGIPMILMGDEYGHTKNGNNNTWGLDSRINWFQWDTLEKNSGFYRFFRGLIHFRKTNSILSRIHFLNKKDIVFHGCEPHQPNWDPTSHFLAFTVQDKALKTELYVAFNACGQPASVNLPANEWKRIVDTAKPSPDDFHEEDKAPEVSNGTYAMAPWSSILLKRSF